MRVLGGGLELEQVHDVDKANLELGEFFPKQDTGSQGFLGGDVAAADQHHVGFFAPVGAGPLPDAQPLGAVGDRRLAVQVLQVRLLVAHDHVDVIGAAQAMVGHRQQAIDVRGQVHADHFGAFVEYNV